MVTYAHVYRMHMYLYHSIANLAKIPSPEERDLLSLFYVFIVHSVLEHLDSRTIRAGVPLSIADITSASHHAVRDLERCMPPVR